MLKEMFVSLECQVQMGDSTSRLMNAVVSFSATLGIPAAHSQEPTTALKNTHMRSFLRSEVFTHCVCGTFAMRIMWHLTMLHQARWTETLDRVHCNVRVLGMMIFSTHRTGTFFGS